jgi:hypothetical protein
MALTKILDSCGHETSEWPHLYETDPNFANTYQMLVANTIDDNFHIQDGLLCHPSHLYIPSSERVKLIWESHYNRVGGNFGMENTVAMLQRHLYSLKR